MTTDPTINLNAATADDLLAEAERLRTAPISQEEAFRIANELARQKQEVEATSSRLAAEARRAQEEEARNQLAIIHKDIYEAIPRTQLELATQIHDALYRDVKLPSDPKPSP